MPATPQTITNDTDLRQGVTATQHRVLDLIDTRTPMWLMQTLDELAARLDREACSTAPDFQLMAALALHIAERTAKPGAPR